LDAWFRELSHDERVKYFVVVGFDFMDCGLGVLNQFFYGWAVHLQE